MGGEVVKAWNVGMPAKETAKIDCARGKDCIKETQRHDRIRGREISLSYVNTMGT
jgi:hypothetical protein